MQHFSLPKLISQQYHVYPMDIISHVAAAPGPLVFPSHSARPPVPVIVAALGPEIVLT